MRCVPIVLVAAATLLAPLLLSGADEKQPTSRTADHRAWVDGILARLDELRRPGTTYAEFTKTFDLDGGLNTVPATRFGLRECPAIKVDVTFNDVPRGQHPTAGATIASISRPYLERPYLD